MNVKVICILKNDIIKGIIDDITNDNNLLDKSIETMKSALERMNKLKTPLDLVMFCALKTHC